MMNIALAEAAASRRGRKTKARRKKLQQANAGYYHNPEIRGKTLIVSPASLALRYGGASADGSRCAAPASRLRSPKS